MKLEVWGKLLDKVRGRRTDYVRTFGSVHGQHVMSHLAEFTHANDSTFNVNDRVSARMEGRREVWLLIQRYMNLSSEQLAAIYAGQTFKPEAEGDENG